MNNQTCDFECLAYNVANQLYGIFADVPSVELESITKTECIYVVLFGERVVI